jgi:hypothetical protein
MRPKGRETWRVQVKTSDGKPAEAGAAELLAYMFDRSLDIFAPHTPPSPLSVYPYRVQPVFLQPNLAQAHAQGFEDTSFPSLPSPPVLRGDRLIFFSGYGEGGPGRRTRKMAFGATGGLPESMPPPAPMAAPAMAALSVSAQVADAPGGRISGEDKAKDEEARKAAPEAPAAELRSDFAETAFWQPHLLTGPDGTASIEFTVPDSVTSWNVWVHAVTRDLRSGALHKEARSVKDLMVRPYVPRFLREGDRAVMKVVVNNAGEKELSGQLSLDILDPDTNRSLLADFGLRPSDAVRPFTVKAGGGWPQAEVGEQAPA